MTRNGNSAGVDLALAIVVIQALSSRPERRIFHELETPLAFSGAGLRPKVFGNIGGLTIIFGPLLMINNRMPNALMRAVMTLVRLNRSVVAGGFVALLTIRVFARVVRYDFIINNGPEYVVDNQRVLDGISLDNADFFRREQGAAGRNSVQPHGR